MYSLLLNRMVNFAAGGGTNLSPAWAPNGHDIAFSSSRSGDPEIYIADTNGGGSHRVTSDKPE
jgi:TolB protein